MPRARRRPVRRQQPALARQHAERDNAHHAHRGERHAPAVHRRDGEAHDRRQRVAQVAADAMRRVGVAQAPRRDVGIEDREVGRMKHAVAHAHQRDDRKQPVDAGRERRENRAAGEQSPGPTAAPDARRRDRRRSPPRIASRRLRHRRRRRASPAPSTTRRIPTRNSGNNGGQRELEEVGERVRGADEADNAHIAAERLGGNGL